jgi:hypothetical protein
MKTIALSILMLILAGYSAPAQDSADIPKE